MKLKNEKERTLIGNTSPKSTATPRDITSLRSTIDWLRANGDLIETDKAVDPDLEITGLQKHLDGGPPIPFENVKGKPHARAITNLFSDIEVVDRMFGFAGAQDRTRKIAAAINRPTEPVEISQDQAPCQEHVITDDPDVNRWITAIRHTDLEGELTVGSGIRCVVGDYFDGGADLGYNRMNFRDLQSSREVALVPGRPSPDRLC